MIALLYGPSGVGKTESLRHAEPLLPDWECISLDALVDQRAKTTGLHGLQEFRNCVGDEGFLEAGQQAIEEMAASCTRHLAVDVGAGFLCSSGADCWLRRHHAILVIAPLVFAHGRIKASRGDVRTLEAYAEDEFSPRRQALYDLAIHRLEIADLSKVEAGARLASMLTSLVESLPVTQN